VLIGTKKGWQTKGELRMHTATAAGHKVQQIRELTDSTYVVRFDKGELSFKTGQYLSVGVRGTGEQREYSIYSGENEPFLEILVKESAEWPGIQGS
jgi:NAD(P)H-flavin reductase